MKNEIEPWGTVSMGSFNIPLKTKVDYEGASSFFKNNNITTNPFNSSFERLYSPRDSNLAYQDDVFRYCDGRRNIGFWYSDRICLCTSTSINAGDYCFRQDF
jgi:hypothetical protein